MAARSPRKIFASPFVVTLAAIPACFTESSAPPQQPQPQPQVQPQPQPDPSPQPTVVIENPPRPTPGGTAAPASPAPPAEKPQTYSFDQRWTVSKTPTGCRAMPRVECPKPTKPGGPMPTCNPPPPMKIACPDGWDGTQALTVVQYANQADCMIEPAPMQCPKNATCNPPPPRKVSCPTYQ